jgi:hypothetical protein
MPSITKQHQGKYTYLYESHSYRDDQGRPRNHKIKTAARQRMISNSLYNKEIETSTTGQALRETGSKNRKVCLQ